MKTILNLKMYLNLIAVAGLAILTAGCAKPWDVYAQANAPIVATPTAAAEAPAAPPAPRSKSFLLPLIPRSSACQVTGVGAEVGSGSIEPGRRSPMADRSGSKDVGHFTAGMMCGAMVTGTEDRT
jgi:hypothetical protein